MTWAECKPPVSEDPLPPSCLLRRLRRNIDRRRPPPPFRSKPAYEVPFLFSGVSSELPPKPVLSRPACWCYRLCSADGSSRAAVLDDLLHHDPKAAKRRRLKAYYFGDFDPADSWTDSRMRPVAMSNHRPPMTV